MMYIEYIRRNKMIEFNIAKGQRFSNIRQYVEKFSKQLGLNGKEIIDRKSVV